MSSKKKYLISLILAVILGINIYSRSDFAPYGNPYNELSDNYWGAITDIAHRWRSFDLTLWNRGVGGGMSLFTSGLYPILNPTNTLAWILNDERFFLVKLIEPYVIGFFFMMILLWDVFKTRWYVACFGALAYMGLPLAKTTTIAESPYFLYGCGIFPVMVFVMAKLQKRHIYLAAAGVGALLALQFLGEGVTQMPQVTIWWMLFFTIHLMAQKFFLDEQKERGIQKTQVLSFLNTEVRTIAILLLVMIGISAIQLIPSIHFFKFESARFPNRYPINNFTLFLPTNGTSLTQIILGGIGLLDYGPIRSKAFLVIVLMCLSLAVAHLGRVFVNSKHKDIYYQCALTTLIFFCIAPVAGVLASWMPFLKKIFTPFTYFTFRYGLHTLDFLLILSVCLIINNEEMSLFSGRRFFFLKGLAIFLCIFAFVCGILPLIMFFLQEIGRSLNTYPFFEYFVTPTFRKGSRVFMKAVAVIIVLAFRPRHKTRHFILGFFLLAIGFMMMLDCFKWYDKGSRGDLVQYQWDSPEHDYFRKAKGKYLLPVSSIEPRWVQHNFPLLYGVYGTSGFMAVAPTRLVKFQYYYDRRHLQESKVGPFLGNAPIFLKIKGTVPSAFASYFPVDFTLAKKTGGLSWEGFSKVIEGEKYDVYERLEPTQRVYFANQLKVVSMLALMKAFDTTRSSVLYVSKEDAFDFSLTDNELPSQVEEAKAYDITQKREDRLSFKVKTGNDIFVIVPERYESGWQVCLDGRKVNIFPADYLFIGFKVPPGEHLVTMKYTPPWFWAGLILNLLAIGGVTLLFKRHYSA